MLSLYEFSNGYSGQAPVRCYVWAHDDDEALALAQQTFKEQARGNEYSASYPDKYWQDLTWMHLFDADAEPFATVPSDTGWEVEAVHWDEDGDEPA